MQCVIHWFRRDLRIADNPALNEASRSGHPVVPVYFRSQWSGRHHWTGTNRQRFLCGCLESLSRNLESIGGRLVIREGDPVSGLRDMIEQTGAVAVYWNKSPDPHGKSVEKQLRALCQALGVKCHAHDDVALHAPDEVLTQSGNPYRVYTPYSRNWLALPKPSPAGLPKHLCTPGQIDCGTLPSPASWGLHPTEAQLPEAGERAARNRLKLAIREKLGRYAANRDFPARDGTSRISQDLRHGTLSIRTVYAECLNARTGADAAGKASIDVWIKELAWREFYFAILHHFPNVLDEEFNPEWRGLPWEGEGELFECWRQGRTGFPIVDAGMRELLATGHMHNRVRMITAMFLTKDLHVDWKLGESHFMQHLVDGEIASNNGGWQWSAGTGADAAPYFRIQNPWTQGARYDSDGVYIKRWIPELARVSPKKLHSPPENATPLADGYPLPCVDHATERNRTLEIFKRHRSESPSARHH